MVTYGAFRLYGLKDTLRPPSLEGGYGMAHGGDHFHRWDTSAEAIAFANLCEKNCESK